MKKKPVVKTPSRIGKPCLVRLSDEQHAALKRSVVNKRATGQPWSMAKQLKELCNKWIAEAVAGVS